jgi:transcriptional regulator with XRE-family HTH domain
MEVLILNKLKDLRRKKGLTLKETSKLLNEQYKLNVSDGQLSNYENGKRTPRDMKTWEVLSDFYNVSVPYLMGIDTATQKEVHREKSFPWEQDSSFNKVLNENAESLGNLFESFDNEFNNDLMFIFSEIGKGYADLYENDEGRNRFESYRKALFRISKYAQFDFKNENYDSLELFMMIKRDEQTIIDFFEYTYYSFLKEIK